MSLKVDKINKFQTSGKSNQRDSKLILEQVFKLAVRESACLVHCLVMEASTKRE